MATATATLGPSIQAAGQFHTVAGASPRSLAVLEWVVLKVRARLPSYPYLAVLPGELVILELRHAATVRVRRVVGRWPLDTIRVLAADAARRQVTLALPGRRFPAVLEGAFGTPSEAAVVTALQAGWRQSGC